MTKAPAVADAPADVLTPEDVEREFKIKVGTQGALRHRRQIPFHKLGGGKIIRYSRTELLAWFASKVVRP